MSAQLVDAVITLVLGFATTFLFDRLKGLSAWIDGLPVVWKQVGVFATSAALAILGHVLQLALPQTLIEISPDHLHALLAGLIAIAIKNSGRLTKLAGK